MKFKLAETKSTFSGRSAASEIVASLSPEIVQEIDFFGVQSMTQSFASEFIRCLIIKKFDLDKIKFSNMDEHCSARINTEIVRIKNIYSKLNEV